MLDKGVDKIDFSVDESLLIDREKAPGRRTPQSSTTSGARR
ncbi:hypothetical protein P4203_20585 [Pseudomonas aeruginosa]|nr:hypothetical protein [Pseudomonas aeruginosa]